MLVSKSIVAAAAATVLFAAVPAFAQQGTTLAGPAQGSKGNGAASTTPSPEYRANGTTGTTGMAPAASGAAATGLGDSRTTATGGNAGGSAGRN